MQSQLLLSTRRPDSRLRLSRSSDANAGASGLPQRRALLNLINDTLS